MVERDGLENRCACKRSEGSNLSLSAICLLTIGDKIKSAGLVSLDGWY